MKTLLYALIIVASPFLWAGVVLLVAWTTIVKGETWER